MKRIAAGLVAVLAGLCTGCATTQEPGELARRVSAATTRQALGGRLNPGALLLNDGSSCDRPRYGESPMVAESVFPFGEGARGTGCRPGYTFFVARDKPTDLYFEQRRLNNAKF